jgi:hypothetical protein
MMLARLAVLGAAVIVACAAGSAAVADPGIPAPSKQGKIVYADGTTVTWVVHPLSVMLVDPSLVANSQSGPDAPATAAPISAAACWYTEMAEGGSAYGGSYYEHWNPTWCGNGSTLSSVDRSNHYQTVSQWWTAQGETPIQTKTGCASGCTNMVSWILGHFYYSFGGINNARDVAMCINVTGGGLASSWGGSPAGGC